MKAAIDFSKANENNKDIKYVKIIDCVQIKDEKVLILIDHGYQSIENEQFMQKIQQNQQTKNIHVTMQKTLDAMAKYDLTQAEYQKNFYKED